MGKSFHDKLRESFLKIANNNPERCKVVSAAGTVEDVAKRIWKIVDV